ncbi:MAG: cysteine desulfurase [Candidatus Mcinerneyibacterium aminivorans]|uniref:cysteine desulfurase n=1 Tax=Candidatus Mcinerneyibacterium aminivorans TaxID=2703815 RepID=A0A5D0M9X2_9BACT|nr:MAG: cysteine desulfurase [Candidatus Mcinerneyibacterium aminivorans]
MDIYLDNNATTPLHPEVKKEIKNFLNNYGNPSSMHETGRKVKSKIKKARENVAEFFDAPANDIIFTASGSESNNTVLKSVLFNNYDFTPHIITTNIEHPAVLETARFLEKNGIEVSYLNVNKDGVVTPEQVLKEIKDNTVLVSIMWANNEIGTLQPIREIGEILEDKDILFHSDAVQAAGKIKLSLRKSKLDFASFSGHKIYAPKGIGVLYFKNFEKNKKTLVPLIHGGHQEKGFRASTENTIGIVAIGKACEQLNKEIDDEIKRIKNLRDLFEKKVEKEIDDIIINGKKAPRLPGTSNITFKRVEGESILLRLDLNGIRVSTGSACSTGSLDPSHVLMAISNKAEVAHGSVRFTFGRENTKKDVDRTVKILKKEINTLRKMSPIK